MFSRILMVMVLLGGIGFAQSDRHQEGSHAENAEGSHSAHSEKGAPVYPCPMLQAHHEQMTGKMATMDEKVSQLVAEMKRARGERKIDVMESLLSTLVEQRAWMHREMISMMPKMMEYVSNHYGSSEHECTDTVSTAQATGE